MKEIKIKHYSIFSNSLYWIKWIWNRDKAVIYMSILQIIVASAAPLIGIYLPKLTIDMVTKGVTVERLTVVLGLLSILIVFVYCLRGAMESGKYWKYNFRRGELLAELFLKSTSIKYDITESGKGKTAYQEALEVASNGDWSALSRTMEAVPNLIINIICFVLYSSVLGSLNLWMVFVLIGLSALNCLWISMNIKYRESMREEEAYAERQYYYVKSVMGDTKAAKDVRIFGMNGWLTGIRDKTIEKSRKIRKKLQDRNAWQEKMSFLTQMIRDMMAYGYLIYMATEGNVTAGEFVLYFGAITGFSNFVSGIVSITGDLRLARNSTDYFRAYMEQDDEDMTSGDVHIRDMKGPFSIEFKDICFSYKAKDNKQAANDDREGYEENKNGKNEDTAGEKVIFNHFNLKIKAGERIALVGINGAGKTTLVKLLCGLYEPDDGQILINGTDTRRIPKGELYDLFSVVFQEQFIMPFSIGENIAMKRPEHIDERKVWDAIERAGMKEIFEEKKINPDTFMTRKILRSGISFSGGQQQRLLLARALYKGGSVMILDEPTAALDPIAESEIYESYNKYTENKTAIFISHRLASTRFSDRIVMIENGKIIDEGTHEELMSRGGAYAEMYNVQSNYYNSDGEEAYDKIMEGSVENV